MRKTAHFIHSRHKLIIAIFAVLTLTSLIMISKMKITTDIIDVLPAKNKVVMQFRDFMEKFSSLENLVVLLEFEGQSLDEQIDIINSLAKKISESPLIEYVDYNALGSTGNLFAKYFPFYLDEEGLALLNRRLSPHGIEKQIRQNRDRLLAPFSSPADNELIEKDPLGISLIVRDSLMRAHGNRTVDMSTGYYITKDNKMAFIFVKPKGKSRDMSVVKNLKTEMASITKSVMAERTSQGVRIGLAGTYAMAEEIREVIWHDTLSSFVLSAILIFLLIWFVYRVRISVLIAIGFTLISSLAMTLSFAYLMFGGLNIITSIVAAVLIGLYVDYSINMISRYGEELRKSGNTLTAVEVAIGKTGPAITVSALTTSLSFFSILVTRFEGLYELGLTSGIGVILCLLSGLFLLPSLLVYISQKSPGAAIPQKNVAVGIGSIISIVKNKPKHIIALSLAIAVIASAGFFKMSFDSDPEHIGLKDSTSMKISKKITDITGRKGEPLILIANAGDRADLDSGFNYLEEMITGWESKGLIKNHDSLGIFLPAPSHQKRVIEKISGIKTAGIEKNIAAAMDKNGFVSDGYVSTYAKGIAGSLSNKKGIGLDELETVTDPRLKHFYNRDSLSLAAYIYPKGKDWDGQTLDKIELGIKSWDKLHHGLSPPLLLGKPTLFREIKSSIIWGSALAIMISLFLNFIVIYLHFRKIKEVLLVMTPITLGLFLTIGFMGCFRISFNFINIGSLALISGLGVDYGIYLMQAYINENVRDVENALNLSGRNIMMCAATTVAGCGSLVAAKMAGIASMGAVLSIGAVFCVIIALVLLPAILNIKRHA